MLIAVAVVMAALVVGGFYGGAVERWFGPPSVTLAESDAAQAEEAQGATFNHAMFDRVLKRYVDGEGFVDYESLRNDTGGLDGYIASLAAAPFEGLGRDEKLALLLNAYNAFTLRLVLDYYPVGSIRDIPSSKRWDDVRWRVGPFTWSLNQIEHEQVRPKFKEPRIHFALVCAAASCPPLRNEAYTADRIEAQLEDQSRYVHSHGRWYRFVPEEGVVCLTKLYDWYGGDFEQVAGSVLGFAARYDAGLQAALDAGRTPRVRWLDYEWALNRRADTRAR